MASSQPISSQPRSVSSCESEKPNSSAVKGIQLLEDAEKFVIQKHIEREEMWYSPNSYHIGVNDSSLEKPLLVAKEEESDHMCFKSLFCCNQRKADLKLVDAKQDTIMWLEHPSSCNWPVFCPSCRPEMILRTSSGRMLGKVEHATRDTCGSWLSPSLYYSVQDANGKSALKIEGPGCKFECCKSTEFRVYSTKWNSYVGEVSHEWQGTCDGLCSCCVTDGEDKTTITFPRELSVVDKGLLLGAAMLTVSFSSSYNVALIAIYQTRYVILKAHN
eukprot:gene10795-11949_t